MSTWNGDSIRRLERESIRRFLTVHRQYLRGRVLDFGAGKPGTCRDPEPYRDLVSGEYVPYDLGDETPHGPFDAVLCTQVLQYVDDPPGTILGFRLRLRQTGYLVLTYPTCWDEVESNDYWRFTRCGMERMLTFAGLKTLIHWRRSAIEFDGFSFPLGYGVIAQPV